MARQSAISSRRLLLSAAWLTRHLRRPACPAGRYRQIRPRNKQLACRAVFSASCRASNRRRLARTPATTVRMSQHAGSAVASYQASPYFIRHAAMSARHKTMPPIMSVMTHASEAAISLTPRRNTLSSFWDQRSPEMPRHACHRCAIFQLVGEINIHSWRRPYGNVACLPLSICLQRRRAATARNFYRK